MYTLIACLGKDRGLGKGGSLLFRIPEDLKRFKRITVKRPVIMGRLTFESMGRPLPDRTNIVVTRNRAWTRPDVIVAHSIDEALKRGETLCPWQVVIGGADIYAQTLERAEGLCLTLVKAAPEADTFFPPYKHLFKTTVWKQRHSYQGLRYSFVDLKR